MPNVIYTLHYPSLTDGYPMTMQSTAVETLLAFVQKRLAEKPPLLGMRITLTVDVPLDAPNVVDLLTLLAGTIHVDSARNACWLYGAGVEVHALRALCDVFGVKHA